MMRSPFVALAAVPTLALSVPAYANSSIRHYEIIHSYERSSETSGDLGSSSSATGSNGYSLIVEDLPSDCSERRFDSFDNPGTQRPLAAWRLPIRVSQCGSEEPRIINEAEMIERLEAFLDAIEADRDACGTYYFTWNLFQIDCDPGAALEELEYLDLQAMDLSVGAIVELAGRAGSAQLLLGSGQDDGDLFAEGVLAPEFLRHEKAEAQVILAMLKGEELTLEDATSQLASDEFSGSFRIVFDIDDDSGSITRTVTFETRHLTPDGVLEVTQNTEATQLERVETLAGPDPSNSQLSD